MVYQWWIIEIELRWPKITFRRYRHRKHGHRKGEITFHDVHENHTITVAFERQGGPHHGG